MSNVKTIKTSNYVQLHNKAGLDKELSAKAKGILFTAMALPPEYEINKTTFHNFFKDGRDSIKGGIEELVMKGYGFHEQITGDGKFDAITLISDVKLTMLAKLDEDELDTFVPEVSDELRYALQRIRETGLTYIGKTHNAAVVAKRKEKKQEDTFVTENQSRTTVTENQSREIRHGKSVRNKEVELKKVYKDFEEEDITTVITESDVINLMHSQIKKHEITNEKTIKAILDVAEDCRAIGTTNTQAAKSYVKKVVIDMMRQLGQKQKVKQPKQRTTHKEQLPEWLEEQKQQSQEPKIEVIDLEEERRRLEEDLKIYKKA
ncbi:hypothetical protein [Ectobacillus funiculus]|uniref:hypothetical protein n=1 Tax=Ectobacillus funiculus TaxID=137993 RepID=UPI00101D6BC9|nr:hypothetical protein [Ectobacillus funiculus]